MKRYECSLLDLATAFSFLVPSPFHLPGFLSYFFHHCDHCLVDDRCLLWKGLPLFLPFCGFTPSFFWQQPRVKGVSRQRGILLRFAISISKWL